LTTERFDHGCFFAVYPEALFFACFRLPFHRRRLKTGLVKLNRAQIKHTKSAMKSFMNAKLNYLLMTLALLGGATEAGAQGTAFTYQGQLAISGSPANGNYDFAFGLYNAPSLGTLVGTPVTNKDVAVADGVFTTVIDFTASPWNGQALYLEILVRTNGNGTFTPLNPLQPITAAPYAITASNLTGNLSVAQLSGTLPISQVGGTLPVSQLPSSVLTNKESGITLSGSFSGNGGSLTNIPLTGLDTGGTLGLSSNGFGFVVVSNITVGLDPFLVIPATNLNGLGRVDLVTPNSGDNTLSVLTNTGVGGFVTSATIPVGSTPYCVAVADLNNDGKPDLANVNYGSASVTILFNTGGGQFTSNQTVAVGLDPTYIVAVSNLSGVGKTGLVVANEGDGTITILTNNGSGIMTSNTTLAAGVGAFGIAVADFNGDGKPDLAVSIFGGNTLIIYTNTGLGTFVSNATLTVGGLPEPVLAVDVNHDGWIDLVCANRNDNTLTVLTNNHGVFTLASTVQGVGSVRVLAVGDFNNDGQPDLVCSSDVNTLQIVFNTGNGTFAPGPSFEGALPGVELRGIAVLDINGDGKLDLVSSTYNNNYLVEWLNDTGLPSADLTLQDGGLSLVSGWNGVPDLIGGSASNVVDATISGSVIAGGGSVLNFNHISADDSSIGGGEGNTIQIGGDHSVIAGGFGNTNAGEYVVVGGGFGNAVQSGASYSDIGGGQANTIQSSAVWSDIAGGQGNTIQSSADWVDIGGGYQNVIGTYIDYAAIAGGYQNTNMGSYSGIMAGYQNQSGGTTAFVGAGAQNLANGNGSFIGGGGFDGNSVIGNNATGAASVVGGGEGNTNSGSYAFVGAGYENVVQPGASYSVVSGGEGNTNAGSGAFIGAGWENLIQTGAVYASIGGGFSNVIATNSEAAVIGSGYENVIQHDSYEATIAGGWTNFIGPSAEQATIGGGERNIVNAPWGMVGGGLVNVISSSSDYAFIGGGFMNSVGGQSATIGGGQNNQANGACATVPGGATNIADGIYSFAAGQQAQALHQGAFVWADSQNATFKSTAVNQFLIRAQGGVGININNPGTATLSVQGGQTGVGNSFNFPSVLFQNTNTGVNNGPALRLVNAGGTNNYGALCVSANVVPGSNNGLIASFGNADSFVVQITNDGTIYSKGLALTSDRNAKENFTAVDHQTVLAKVIAMPVTEWNYKGDAAGKKHIGPVAQDFQAAFGLDGADDKHISVVDEGGVALAAIQGLTQKVEEKEARIQAQESRIQNQAAEITDLKQELGQLKQLVNTLNRKFDKAEK
jgi:hypothetical protein